MQRIAEKSRCCQATSVLLCSLLGAASPAFSAGEGPGLTLGVTAAHSDNIQKLPEGGTSETWYGLAAGLDYTRNTERLDMLMKGSINYNDYGTGSYGGDLSGTALGSIIWKILPGRLSWSLENSLSQALRDPFGTDTPDNLTVINAIRTGPTLSLVLGERSTLTWGATYGLTEFESANYDSRRLASNLSLRRVLTERQTIGIQASASRTSYVADDVYDRFSSRSAGLVWDFNTPKTRFAASAGHVSNRSRGDVGSDGMVYYDASIGRRLGASTRLDLSYRVDESDLASAIWSKQTLNLPGVPLDIGDQVLAQGALKVRSATLALVRDREPTTTGLFVSWASQDFDLETGLRNKGYTVGLQLERRFGQRWRIGADARFSHYDYTEQDVDFDQGEASLSATTRLRAVDLQLRYTHNSRFGPVADGAFDENVVQMNLSYAFGR